MQITLDTVYKTLANAREGRGSTEVGTPSIDISGGTINIYVSNAEDMPVKAAMTQSNADVATGIHGVALQSRWILFESASSSPVVNEMGVVVA